MDSHQAHIKEYSSRVELQIIIRIQLWELTTLFLKKIDILSKEGMLRQTSILL